MKSPKSSRKFAPELENYLSSSTDLYEACLDALPEVAQLKNVRARLRFQFLKMNPNGAPKFRELAEGIANQMVEYCFSASKRKMAKTPSAKTALALEARKLLRRSDTSGESGEMLLYLLLESVLKAPQVVAKMDLKTNRKMELHGSDGIHMRWDEDEEALDLYFGEAKLEGSLPSALSSAAESIQNFHTEGLREREFGMVTSHYKHLDSATKDEVMRLIDGKTPTGACRINHGCLIGYTSAIYSKLQNTGFRQMEAEFATLYADTVARIKQHAEAKLGSIKVTDLRFEVFILPFRTVQEFRDAFNSYLE